MIRQRKCIGKEMREPLLEVRVDQKSFGKLPILQEVYFTIEEGEYVSLVGPSGCGKTTLLRLIAGLENDFQGEITVNGHPPIVGYDTRMMFQESRLFPWLSARENIELGLQKHPLPVYQRGLGKKSLSDPRVDALLKKSGLEPFAGYMPGQLSGGMQQRIALLRALISTPKLLLLDEPFSKLDYLTALPLQEEVSDLVRGVGVTAFMITHNIEEAVYLSDRILLLSSRPATIVRAYDIKLPQPRERMSDEIQTYVREILRQVQGEMRTS